MPKTKHKTPSQIKYDQNHPTISFRLSKELHDQLERHLSDRGVSFADFVEESLGAQQLKMPDIEEIEQEAWEKGFIKGEADIQIWFHCYVCKKRINITPNSKVHMEIIRHLEEAHWGHAACIRQLRALAESAPTF